MQPPQVRPVTDSAGPAQVQGSVGSRSPNSLSAAGSGQSLPMSSDSPGSVTSSRSPVSRAARSDCGVYGVDARPGTQVDLGRTAVEAGDPVAPQPVQEVGVVAVAEEGLGVGADQVRVEVRHHRDLVLAADRRQHRPDLGIAEGRVEVGGAVPRGRSRGVGSWGTRPAPDRSPRRGAPWPARAPPARRRGRRRRVTRRPPCLLPLLCEGRRLVAASGQSIGCVGGGPLSPQVEGPGAGRSRRCGEKPPCL